MSDGLPEDRDARQQMADAIEKYAQWCGGVHDEDCPEDDTCDCSGKWINDGITSAVNYLRAEDRLSTLTRELDTLKWEVENTHVQRQAEQLRRETAERDRDTLQQQVAELLVALEESPHDDGCHAYEGTHTERCERVTALIRKHRSLPEILFRKAP